MDGGVVVGGGIRRFVSRDGKARLISNGDALSSGRRLCLPFFIHSLLGEKAAHRSKNNKCEWYGVWGKFYAQGRAPYLSQSYLLTE